MPQHTVAFLDFTLDPLRGHLYRGTEPVPLTPKAFALLGYLSHRAGTLVSKQELRSWKRPAPNAPCCSAYRKAARSAASSPPPVPRRPKR